MTTLHPTTIEPIERFHVAILTAVGWSTSRSRYKHRRRARRAALWFLSCSGVQSVRVLDAAGQTIVEIHHPRRKPR